MRVGRWKLYLEPKNGVECLFDLLEDPQESTDLKAQHPEIHADLKARYVAWDKSLPPRAWTHFSPVFKK